MTEMIERIARKLAGQYMVDDGYSEDTRVSAEAGEMWKNFRGAARVAIEAMRAPTDEMCQGAKPYMDSWSSNIAWWIAMHDMALHGAQHAQEIIRGIDQVNDAIRAARVNIHQRGGE